MIQSHGRAAIFNLTLNVVQLVAEANPRRVALGFGCAGANPVTVHPDPNVDTTRGAIIRSSIGPWFINLRDHGKMVQLAWYAVAGGASSVSVYESISDAE